MKRITVGLFSIAMLSCGTLAPAQTQYFIGSNGIPQGYAVTDRGTTVVYDTMAVPVQIQTEYRSPSEGMWDYNASKNMQQQYITTPQNLQQQSWGSRDRVQR